MSTFDLKVARKYISLQQSALSRGKEFNLTLTGVKNLVRAKKCYYTGEPLTDKNRSIDRVDSSKGYVTGNVVACSVRVNLAKTDLTYKELKRMVKKMESAIALSRSC